MKVHDFIDDDLGRVVPYGVYGIAANAGCVSVGIDNDTAPFAVNSIRCWLDVMGRERYPDADRMMITADGGGSNGSRVRRKRKPTPTFRRGPDLSRLRAVVGEAVGDGRDRVLL